MTPPTLADIRHAANRIAGMAVRTPLLNSAALDAMTGLRLFLKAENLQRTGSFKFRGAYNTLSALGESGRAKGVTASSSGNHAQGVAEAARLFGVPATIVMPSDAPAMKIERTRASGATVVLYDRATEDRDALARQVTAETGGVYIHPFEHPNVIAGQGTAGLEIADDLSALGVTPDRVLVCTGGGGLTAGVALAISDRFPACKIHACEPEGFDDYGRSLVAGTRVENTRRAGSVCDAILTPGPGELSFAINSARHVEGISVSDEQALEAMRVAFSELKLVVEPGGAVALAAALANAGHWRGQTVVALLSGGNVDPALFARTIARQP